MLTQTAARQRACHLYCENGLLATSCPIVLFVRLFWLLHYAQCVSCKYVGVFFSRCQPRCGCVSISGSQHLHNGSSLNFSVGVCSTLTKTCNVPATANHLHPQRLMIQLNDSMQRRSERRPHIRDSFCLCRHTFTVCFQRIGRPTEPMNAGGGDGGY